MYDSAKRSLACTVATGGLLLTGAAYSPAMAATAEPAGAPDGASAAQATAETTGSPGVLSGNTLQLPLNLGLDLCGNTVQAASALNTVGGTRCDAPSGAAATGTVANSGGIGSGNQIQLPVNAPILACGNDVTVLGALNNVGATTCAPASGAANASPGGAQATATSTDSGGVLSGNIVQAPITAPVLVCGASVDVAAAANTRQGSTCATAEGSAPSGASATAGSTGNKGVASGNVLQLPVNAPVLLCGDGVDAISALNSVLGSTCTSSSATSSTSTSVPPTPVSVPPAPPTPPVPPLPFPPATTASPNVPIRPIGPDAGPMIGLAAHASPVGPGRHRLGALARTGADIDVPLGAAGAVVAAGLGLQVLGRRRRVRG